MTMTPEDKAKRVAGEIESLCCDYVGVFFFKEELAVRLISSAIREAEDAALGTIEKRLTARILDFEGPSIDPDDEFTDTVLMFELRQIRDDIRSLKSKD